VVVWIGVESYAVYLFHQPPLKWAAAFGDQKAHLAAPFVVLLLSFPVGWLINGAVAEVLRFGKKVERARFLKSASLALSIGAGLGLLFMNLGFGHPGSIGCFSGPGPVRGLALPACEYVRAEKETWFRGFLRSSIICASVLLLFLVPCSFGEHHPGPRVLDGRGHCGDAAFSSGPGLLPGLWLGAAVCF